MKIFVFRCGHFQRQQWVYYVTASCVPQQIPMNTTWYDHSPCAEGRFSTPHKSSNSTDSHGDRQPWRPTAMATARKQNNKPNKQTGPWLSSSRSDWRALQRRCHRRQPTRSIQMYYKCNMFIAKSQPFRAALYRNKHLTLTSSNLSPKWDCCLKGVICNLTLQ